MTQLISNKFLLFNFLFAWYLALLSAASPIIFGLISMLLELSRLSEVSCGMNFWSSLQENTIVCLAKNAEHMGGLKTALWHSFWDKIENRPALTYIIVLYQCAVTLALCELDMHMPCCVDCINGKKISEEYDFCLSNSAVLYTPYYS